MAYSSAIRTGLSNGRMLTAIPMRMNFVRCAIAAAITEPDGMLP